MAGRPTLAALIHDVDGHLLAPLARVGVALPALFEGMALGITEATDERVVAALAATPGTRISRHRVGEDIIGRARRNAVALALELGASQVFHSDFDGVLRWLEADKNELSGVLARRDPFLIVGRSPAAVAGLPARLRETEGLVNRVYGMMTGQPVELLAAVRSMDRGAAQAIVAHAREESIGSDVEWPLIAARLGFPITHVEVDGLAYRTMEEYDADADSLDPDPLQWIRRIEFAAEQAGVLRRFLNQGSS